MSDQTRRDFLKHTTAAAATFSAGCASTQPNARLAKRGPSIVSTWGFGKPANELALKVLQGGGSALDAVEQGVRLVESSGNTSVGLSGKPNAAGVVQLDACIMNGPGHQAGSVAGVEGVVHPPSDHVRLQQVLDGGRGNLALELVHPGDQVGTLTEVPLSLIHI